MRFSRLGAIAAAVGAVCLLAGWSFENDPRENKVFDKDIMLRVAFAAGGAKKEVNLKGLPAFDDHGVLAVRLHHVVLKADLPGFRPKERRYAFNFISNDPDGNWNLLSHLSGVEELPVWEDKTTLKDLQHGWIEAVGDFGYQLQWAEESGITKRKKVKHMENGGTIVIMDLADAAKNQTTPQ